MQIVPLGGITPGASSPVVINTNFPTINRASKITVASLVTNTAGARIYVGASNMNISTLAGVVAVLSPGEQYVLVDEKSTTFQVDKLYVIAENGTDGVLVVGYVR